MTIQRMEHVGIVVDDLAAATAFFVELGPRNWVEQDQLNRRARVDGLTSEEREELR